MKRLAWVSASWVVASTISSCPWGRCLAKSNVSQSPSRRREASTTPTVLEYCKYSAYFSDLNEEVLPFMLPQQSFLTLFWQRSALHFIQWHTLKWGFIAQAQPCPKALQIWSPLHLIAMS